MKRTKLLIAFSVAISIPAGASLAREVDDRTGNQAEEITDRKHPDFIRCRTESVIGSRAKKRKVCLTNRQWEEFARRGNEVARRTVEDNAH